MQCGRDYQKSKVYKWEQKIIAPFDNALMTMNEIRDFVDFVWANEGLQHPPKITAGQKNKSGADGWRLEIRLPPHMRYRWIVIHELVHSFLEDGTGTGDGHGPMFVTKYINLLDKYMCIPKMMLWYTLKEAKVDYNINP